jgi:hypothetical protein
VSQAASSDARENDCGRDLRGLAEARAGRPAGEAETEIALFIDPLDQGIDLADCSEQRLNEFVC